MAFFRVGLAKTKDFAEGWDAIFGKKSKKAPKASARKGTVRKKTAKKKKK